MQKISFPMMLEATFCVACFDKEFWKKHDTGYPRFSDEQYFIINSISYLALLALAGLLWAAYSGAYFVIAKEYRRCNRPKYYPAENERRRMLTAERRKIRKRTTLNQPPTAEQLRAQYAKVKRNPKEMIRFGSMLCDLEAYVDNSLLRDDSGEITGRRPGIKGWLAEHCPEMHRHYKSVIRYKAMAEKFRQAVGLADPHPATEALDDENETTERNTDKSAFNSTQNKALEIFTEAGKSEAGLMAVLSDWLDPDILPVRGSGRYRRSCEMTA